MTECLFDLADSADIAFYSAVGQPCQARGAKRTTGGAMLMHLQLDAEQRGQ